MRRRLALAAALVALSAASPLPAAAASPPPPPWAPGPAASAVERDLVDSRAELARETAALDVAHAEATRALQAAQGAQRRAEEAARAYVLAVTRHRSAQAAAASAQRELQTFAGSLYRLGGQSPEVAWYLGAVGGADPRQLLGNLDLAERVGEHDGEALDALEFAESEQEQAARAAEQAAAAQRRANQRAQETRAAADAVVRRARAEVARSQAAVTTAAEAVAAAHRRDALVARVEAIARQRSQVPAAAIAGALAPRPHATCTGGVLRGYPNGTLPEQALCALWGTSGQMLRADAAAAFDEMSRAYALELGEPLCVTDSYRSLPEQVAVAAAKPHLAARPGTSNHGWAVALDLCGGVQTFGSPQHEWMVANSLRFGWFHPAWAQQGGSKPEAWHWEFAG